MYVVGSLVSVNLLQNHMFGKETSEEQLQQALYEAQITDELCSKLVHMWWDLYGEEFIT